MSGFTEGMRTSDSEEWTTPKWLFDELDAEFHFTLDAASTHGNALCEKHFTKADDGLSQPWEDEIVWLNPPYGRVIGDWMRKAAETDGGGSSWRSFRAEPTRNGGSIGSWGVQPRSGSFAEGSDSAMGALRLRSRRQSWCTTSGRAAFGSLEGSVMLK